MEALTVSGKWHTLKFWVVRAWSGQSDGAWDVAGEREEARWQETGFIRLKVLAFILLAVGSHGSEARDKFDETCILEKGGKLTWWCGIGRMHKNGCSSDGSLGVGLRGTRAWNGAGAVGMEGQGWTDEGDAHGRIHSTLALHRCVWGLTRTTSGVVALKQEMKQVWAKGPLKNYLFLIGG